MLQASGIFPVPAAELCRFGVCFLHVGRLGAQSGCQNKGVGFASCFESLGPFVDNFGVEAVLIQEF